MRASPSGPSVAAATRLHSSTYTLVMVVCAVIALIGTLTLTCQPATAKEVDHKALREDIKKYDTCVLRALWSFRSKDSLPPRTLDELKTRCRTQADAFKCIKEQTKGADPLIKRGLLTLVGTRSRQHKRLCTNPDSEQARNFVAGTKCIMDQTGKEQGENDAKLIATLAEIVHRNYNDSVMELKQICCTLYNFRQKFYELAEKSCASHKAMFADLIGAIVTDDVTIICDDEEKLAKVCPKVEPLKITSASSVSGAAGASSALYLIATLGEPEKDRPVLN